MRDIANVAVHASQFPEAVRRDLLESLRTRRVNPKFLYDSVRQTQKWLALHQAFSPSRNDGDCAAIYGRSFDAVASRIKARGIHLIGLGCGGGQKDARLLKLLKAQGKEVFYTPCDVSTAMVLVARQAALAVVPERNCFPLVCDLATADDLPLVLRRLCAERAAAAIEERGCPSRSRSAPTSIPASRPATALATCCGWDTRAPKNPGEASATWMISGQVPARLITFFGIIPNFEPQIILPKLAALVRRNDHLLFSANLAPGKSYADGMKRILPQYDNPLTRDWLMTFLLDLGVERTDGELRFRIESGGPGGRLKRVAADFRFARAREIKVDSERFGFCRGETLRLFFSYRHTPALVRSLLERHGLRVRDQWIARSEEEGVFLCNAAPG
jgi:uncharacterized SAM-dependent methyltransferase